MTSLIGLEEHALQPGDLVRIKDLVPLPVGSSRPEVWVRSGTVGRVANVYDRLDYNEVRAVDHGSDVHEKLRLRGLHPTRVYRVVQVDLDFGLTVLLEADALALQP